MINGRTFIISTLIISALLSDPLTAAAQVRQQYDPNATLNMNGSTFGGVNFSGVGGAIAACTNVGDTLAKWTGSATSAISGLFKAKPKTNPLPNVGGNATAIRQENRTGAASSLINGSRDLSVNGLGQSVPVTDTRTQEELAKANQREACLNGIAYAVAKSMLQQITNKTLSWVNTGFNGNPLYVRNLDSYLGSIANQQTARFLNQIPNQNPTFGNAIRSIITEQVTGVQDGLLSATMNTPQGRAYESFQQDFTNGGWAAFLNPSNNPIDAVFNASDDLNQNIAAQQQDVKNQLQRNGGLLDLTRCVEYADGAGSSAGERGTRVTAGNPEDDCLKWETVTPGSVISAQVNAVTTSPIRQLEQADKINEVLGAFFDQMLNNLYSAGLGALRGKNNGTTFTLGAPGANVIIGSNGSTIQTSTQNALGYNPSNGGISSVDFDVSRPQQVRTILEVQYDYLNRAQDAQAAEQRLVPVLGALDYCIPGPNPTWNEGLAENVQTYTGNLQIPTSGQGTTGSSLGSTLGSVGGTIGGSAAGAAIGGALGTALPGIGTIIGGALGSIIGGLFDGGKPHGLVAANVSLFDKVTAGPILISDSAWREPNRSPEAVYENLQIRLKEVLDTYNRSFTLDTITAAFVNADSANADYARGFVGTSFDETAKLPGYDQALAEIDSNYTTSIANSKNAIAELESIRQEVNDIVTTAKARYIAEQAAAGTPVNRTCLDQAYAMDTTAVTVPSRIESDTPSPYLDQSTQAAIYFYSHL